MIGPKRPFTATFEGGAQGTAQATIMMVAHDEASAERLAREALRVACEAAGHKAPAGLDPAIAVDSLRTESPNSASRLTVAMPRSRFDDPEPHPDDLGLALDAVLRDVVLTDPAVDLAGPEESIMISVGAESQGDLLVFRISGEVYHETAFPMDQDAIINASDATALDLLALAVLTWRFRRDDGSAGHSALSPARPESATLRAAAAAAAETRSKEAKAALRALLGRFGITSLSCPGQDA